MADVQRVPGFIEPFSYPVWVVVDSEAEQTIGPSFAMHYLTAMDGSGEKHLPVFRTEAMAAEYVANNPGLGYRVALVDSPDDFLILLNLFRSRGGTHVRIDETTQEGTGLFSPELAGFIAFIRGTG